MNTENLSLRDVTIKPGKVSDPHIYVTVRLKRSLVMQLQKYFPMSAVSRAVREIVIMYFENNRGKKGR